MTTEIKKQEKRKGGNNNTIDPNCDALVHPIPYEASLA
jgi:hypothetical protein